MTHQEFEDLEVGDVITNNGINCKVTQVENLHHHKRISISDDSGYHKYKISRNPNYYEMQTIDPIWFRISIEYLKIVSKKSTKSLETTIKEKEIELETLKKELKEINRKKMFENLDPNTIYKIIHEDFDIGFVRKWNDDSYRIFDITTRLIITIPKDCITEIIPLKEATETYKKLKNLLESA